MAQHGSAYAELADAICASASASDAAGIPLEPLIKPTPTRVEMRFEAPMEFRQDFRIEGERRRLSDEELLMLCFQTYVSL
jgi:hypothetical protein